MVIDSGLAHASRDHTLVGPLWEGYHASRRCSKETFPEAYINNFTRIQRQIVCRVYTRSNETHVRVECQGEDLGLRLMAGRDGEIEFRVWELEVAFDICAGSR
jgi:hypothetical protein